MNGFNTSYHTGSKFTVNCLQWKCGRGIFIWQIVTEQYESSLFILLNNFWTLHILSHLIYSTNIMTDFNSSWMYSKFKTFNPNESHKKEFQIQKDFYKKADILWIFFSSRLLYHPEKWNKAIKCWKRIRCAENA